MSKQFWKMFALTVATILVSLFIVVGQTLLASATIPKQQTIAQVTSISQNHDVRPGDYYYEGLKSLTEEYGCAVGYADGTFRAARPLQSAELVGYLNACMDRMGEVVAGATADIPKAEDLGTMQGLLREIATEVSSMRR